MENSILMDAIGKKGLNTYITGRKYDTYYFEDFFPAKNTNSIKYETLIGANGAPVAADVVTYDSSAPQKKRKTVSTLTGDIPPIRIKKGMKDSDLINYHTMSQMADPGENAILDLVFDDVDAVFTGCKARLEWISLSVLSYPTLSLTTTNNAGGIVTETAIDFQLPTANKLAAAVKWDATASTTTPITDFIAAQTAARAIGVRLNYALMTPTSWGYFALSAETKSYVNYNREGTTTVVPLFADVNRMLADRGLPQIIVIDTSITTEKQNGVQATANPWKEGYVEFIPELAVGDMLYAPIAEVLRPPKQALQEVRENILISKYSEIDPVKEWTKGETNAFPSWGSINECFNLYTLDTSWS